MASKSQSKIPNGNVTQSKESHKETQTSKPANPSANPGHDAIAILSELGAVMKKVSEHSSTYANFEKILDQNSDLKLQISDKNAKLLAKEKRISSLEDHCRQSLDEFARKYNEWAAEKGLLQQQAETAETDAAEKGKVARAEIENKAKKEVSKLKKELATQKAKFESLAQKLDASRENEARLQGELGFTKSALKEWEGKLSALKDIDVAEFTQQFQELMQRYMTFMRSNFQRDLPGRLLADRPQWENLRKNLDFPLNFPASNTAAAKNTRLTAALRTLSQLLNDYIFAPYHSPSDPSDNQRIKMLLHRQLDINERRENMVRSLLLFPSTQDEIAYAKLAAVEITVKKGQDKLRQMLDDPQKFRDGLQPVLEDFVNLWDVALSSKKFVLASTEEESEWEWGYMPEFDDEYPMPDMESNHAKNPNLITLNLFPRVFIPESAEVIDPGILVWSDQNSVKASEAEYQKELHDRRNSANGNGGGPVGPAPRRPRRQSTVDGGRSSQNGSAPSSPLIGKSSEIKSFLGGGSSLQRSNTTNGSRGSGG